jgi:hypothetical protein
LRSGAVAPEPQAEAESRARHPASERHPSCPNLSYIRIPRHHEIECSPEVVELAGAIIEDAFAPADASKVEAQNRTADFGAR